MISIDNDLRLEDIQDEADAVEYCIQGVVDNNHINGGSWGDWMDSYHICEVYLDTSHEWVPVDVRERIERLDWIKVEAGIDKRWGE